MKIIFFALSDQKTASSRTRVFQYLPYLNAKGVETKVYTRNPYYLVKPKNFFLRIVQRIHIRINENSFFVKALFNQFIFLQKVYLPKYMVYTFSVLKKVIIYDFDDAIYITEHNKSIKKEKLDRLIYTLKKAKLVIVENEVNRAFSNDYCKNVLIITGPIECNRYKPIIKETTRQEITIGWIGSSGTTMYLSVVKNAIESISKKYPFVKVLLIGASDIEFQGVTTEIVPWKLETEVSYLEKFDIGIMPLFNDEWSSGKGGYKLLQYMAMGIPSIATNCGINNEIVSNGTDGFLAATENDWVQCIETLLLDKDLRKKMGQKARTKVLEEYSFEYYTPIILDSLKKLN